MFKFRAGGYFTVVQIDNEAITIALPGCEGTITFDRDELEEISNFVLADFLDAVTYGMYYGGV